LVVVVLVVLVQRLEVIRYFQLLHLQVEVVEVVVILQLQLLLKQVDQVEEDHQVPTHLGLLETRLLLVHLKEIMVVMVKEVVDMPALVVVAQVL
jgi:hypothetical protein